jgi:lipid-binding SYLF domain-containing protein
MSTPLAARHRWIGGGRVSTLPKRTASPDQEDPLIRPILAHIALFAAITVVPAGAQEVREDVLRTIEEFKAADPGIAPWFNSAYGYAVFPNVGKGAFFVGGGHGTGQVFRQGELIGKSDVTMVSFGLQFGGQAFSEIIFFQNEETLNRLIDSSLEFGAGVSAVVLASGVSADASYRNGVAVFTRTKGGAMAEISIGGQKFDFVAFDY